jgi:peroxiredoxin Q/BCP
VAVLKVGAQAPDFTAEASTGQRLSLGELRGRYVVLYFYPKAFTPGCTLETRLFRDNYDEIRALGAEVVGVSVDDLATQCRFAAAQSVRFPLLSDPDLTIAGAYGVRWPLVPLDKRVTFVLDKNGVIRAVFRHEFQISRHLDDVVRFLRREMESGRSGSG